MRGVWRLLDRFVILGLCLIFGVSSGVASVATGEAEVTTGHTAFVSIVRDVDASAELLMPPVEYGLASYRATALFGAYDRTRPLDEGKNHMVFAWAADRPDPRRDPTIGPTGAFAQITDLTGAVWTIYEFSYHAADSSDLPPGATYPAPPHYAYGVRLGATDEHPDPDKGRYNYALSYRIDRLFPAAFAPPVRTPADAPATIGTPATPAVPLVPLDVLPKGTGSTGIHLRTLGDDGPPAELRVVFGVGKVPPILENADPTSPDALPHGRVRL